MENLDRLNDLYSKLDELKASGEDVVAEIRAEINNIELKELKEFIFPKAMRELANLLSVFQCTLDFSFQYDGNGVIDYSFCKSGSMSLIRDKAERSKEKPTFKAPTTNTSKRSNVIVESSNAQTFYRIVDYSDRAIAVYGVPKIYTEKFKEIGGYFDKHLREGAGWIFSKKLIDEVRKILSTQTITIEDCPPSITPTIKHKNNIVQARNKPTPVPGKLSIGNFIYYLSSIKNAHGRNFTPSSVSVYSSATRSDYMSEKVRKYDSTGVIYNIKDKKLLVKLYNDIKDDVENGHKSQSFLQAVKLYFQFFEEMTSSYEHKNDISLIHNETPQTTLSFENETNSNSTSSKRETATNIIINSIRFDGYNITQGNSTEKFIEFINSIGPDLVYEMYIPFREGLLVDKTCNLKYIAFCKQLNDGYWLNTHSSTLKKIELMRKICENLDVEIHIDFDVPDLVS